MIVIAVINGWEWLVLGCYNHPQNLLCSLLLGKSHQAGLQSEVFARSINLFILVSGHISDLTVELSFRWQTEFKHICEDKSYL